jgi:hypothetical protein
MANLFISHRGSDTAKAELLAEELRVRGHQAWLDTWDIKVGDSIIAKINAGLSGSSYLVLCYSAADVLAPWISREWMSVLARQLEGHSIKLLPVRLSGGEAPAILADIRYADLEADWDKGVSDLINAIH